MNKRIIYTAVLALLFFSKPCYAQLTPWQPGIRLAWNDFVAAPDPASSYWAYTYTYISYKWKWDADGNITVTVDCSLDLSKSWKQADKNLTPELLQHEQLHFDVSEIFARKMRQAFIGYAAFHKQSATTAKDLKNIFDRVMAECATYNALYDNESDHSRDKAKQAEWNKKIATDLQSLSAFANK